MTQHFLCFFYFVFLGVDPSVSPWVVSDVFLCVRKELLLSWSCLLMYLSVCVEWGLVLTLLMDGVCEGFLCEIIPYGIIFFSVLLYPISYLLCAFFFLSLSFFLWFLCNAIVFACMYFRRYMFCVLCHVTFYLLPLGRNARLYACLHCDLVSHITTLTPLCRHQGKTFFHFRLTGYSDHKILVLLSEQSEMCQKIATRQNIFTEKEGRGRGGRENITSSKRQVFSADFYESVWTSADF